MDKQDYAAILGPMRLPFLVLTPACVLLGTAAAIWTGASIRIPDLILALVGGLAAHISVNALNEYEDFKSGLDFMTTKTPFSGGSGTLPKLPHKSLTALIVGVVTLLLTVCIGLYFVMIRGWGIVVPGVIGVVLVTAYTRFLTRNALMCLVAPGLGFGPIMVMGTEYVLTGGYSTTGAVVSLVPFFLVSGLLLLNQLPDTEADRSIGRNHLPIVIGRQNSAVIYGILLVGAYLSVLAGLIAGLLPMEALIPFSTVFIAVPTFIGAMRHAESISGLTPYLAKNVMVVISFPVLLSAGMMADKFF